MPADETLSDYENWISSFADNSPFGDDSILSKKFRAREEEEKRAMEEKRRAFNQGGTQNATESGYYFKTNGDYLGRVFNAQNKVEDTVLVVPDDQSDLVKWLKGDHKPFDLVQSDFKKIKKLEIKFELFRKYAATVYGEGTPAGVKGPGAHVFEESYAIANAIYNCAKYVEKIAQVPYLKVIENAVTQPGYSMAVNDAGYNRFLGFKLEELNETASCGAIINALMGWKDYSEGATHWDGLDNKMYSIMVGGTEQFAGLSTGKFPYGFTTYLWNPNTKNDIEDEDKSLAKVFFENCGFNNRANNPKPVCRYPIVLNTDPKTIKDIIAFRATAVYSRSIFWRLNFEQYPINRDEVINDMESFLRLISIKGDMNLYKNYMKNGNGSKSFKHSVIQQYFTQFYPLIIL